MIIVSQNKRKIINFENIVEIFLVECSSTEYQIQYQSKEHWYDNLGVYKKERAKEVLQEIISKYKTTLYNSKTNETVVNIPKVYEMPKE